MEEMSLGKALALLQLYPDCCRELPRQFQQWHEFVHALRERREQLHADPARLAKIFQAFSDEACAEEQPLLAGHTDFFLFYTLIAPQRQGSVEECLRLIRHLNGCYLCFEEYGPILQEYDATLLELNGTQALRAKESV